MKKRFAWLFSFLLLMLCGCAAPLAGDTLETTAPTGLSGSLQVYYPATNERYKSGIEAFRQANPGVTLIAEGFDAIAEMEQRLTSEWSAGKGPDVALFTHATTLDIPRLMQNGVFMDVTPYIEAGNNVKNSYLSAAWDAASSGDTPYLFPIGLRAYSITTSTETMAGLGVTLEETPSFEAVMDAIQTSILATKDDPLALGARVWLPSAAPLPAFMRLHGGFGFGENAGTPELDKAALKAMANIIISDHPNDAKHEAVMGAYGTSNFGAVYKAFGLSLLDSYYNCHTSDAIFSAIGETPIFLPIPSQTGGYTATLSAFGGISAASPNGELAFAFLEALASPNTVDASFARMMPANKAVMINLLERMTQSSGGTMEVEPKRYVHVTALSAERHQQLINWYLGIDKVYMPNGKVDALINQAMAGYLASSNSFENAYADLTRRLTLYLNE